MVTSVSLSCEGGSVVSAVSDGRGDIPLNCSSPGSTMMRYSLLMLLTIVGCSCAQPNRPVWEVFIDPLCPHCKEGWPTVIQVAERFGSSLNAVVHPFPAPFHHNSFFASRALHIAQMNNASLVYPLLELIFGNQESFSNPSTKNETPIHVVNRLVSLASILRVSPNILKDGFNDVNTDQATRLSFKYGCSRGVVGTPTYLLNGMPVAGANNGWTVDDWAKILTHDKTCTSICHGIPLIAKLTIPSP